VKLKQISFSFSSFFLHFRLIQDFYFQPPSFIMIIELMVFILLFNLAIIVVKDLFFHLLVLQLFKLELKLHYFSFYFFYFHCLIVLELLLSFILLSFIVPIILLVLIILLVPIILPVPKLARLTFQLQLDSSSFSCLQFMAMNRQRFLLSFKALIILQVTKQTQIFYQKLVCSFSSICHQLLKFKVSRQQPILINHHLSFKLLIFLI
jgi:hypothetical protein